MEYIAQCGKDGISVRRLVWIMELRQEERDDAVERVVANGSFKDMLSKTGWMYAIICSRVVDRHALTILIACWAWFFSGSLRMRRHSATTSSAKPSIVTSDVSLFSWDKTMRRVVSAFTALSAVSASSG